MPDTCVRQKQEMATRLGNSMFPQELWERDGKLIKTGRSHRLNGVSLDEGAQTNRTPQDAGGQVLGELVPSQRGIEAVLRHNCSVRVVTVVRHLRWLPESGAGQHFHDRFSDVADRTATETKSGRQVGRGCFTATLRAVFRKLWPAFKDDNDT